MKVTYLSQKLAKTGILMGLFLMGSWISFSQCSPDLTPPVITCPADTTMYADLGVCGAIVNYTLPSATDNCDVDTTIDYVYTGAMETFTVPGGVTTITLECWGAEGLGATPGLGGYSAGDLTTTGGEVLNIYVGGQANWNGGGVGINTGSAGPYHGGDASDIRLTGTALTDRIIVAGGGGGGGTVGPNYAGGGGGAGGVGGATGGSGNSSCHSGGAGGGGFTTGGQGSCSTCYIPHCATDGALGLGGDGSGAGSYAVCYSTYGGVAGGGAGYYGGGGSSVGYCRSGAGGGGSSFVGSLTATTLTGGVQSGEGQVSIT